MLNTTAMTAEEEARAIVEQRRAAALEAAKATLDEEIAQETFRIESNRQAAHDQEQLLAGLARNKQARDAAHERAYEEARAAKRELNIATSKRKECEVKAGACRADQLQNQKEIQRHPAPNLDDYEEAEVANAWRQRHEQLLDAARRHMGLIAIADAELGAAQQVEWSLEAKFDEAASRERNLRG